MSKDLEEVGRVGTGYNETRRNGRWMNECVSGEWTEVPGGAKELPGSRRLLYQYRKNFGAG